MFEKLKDFINANDILTQIEVWTHIAHKIRKGEELDKVTNNMDITIIQDSKGEFKKMYHYNDSDSFAMRLLELDIKKGNIVQPRVIHSDLADYGLSKIESIRINLRYLHHLKKILETREADTKSLLMRHPNWHSQWQHNIAQKELDKVNKNIRIKLDQLKTERSGKSYPQRIEYDLERIKKVPCNLIADIAPSGFFIVNPFRNERSPSNSLHWNKTTNRWTDYGSGQHGDNLDLYMKIYDCDLPTALRNLSNMG
jgi:hypothetical protein